jgi:hypothetical protein
MCPDLPERRMIDFALEISLLRTCLDVAGCHLGGRGRPL